MIYASVQEIKHDTNKARDNSTDTFKSNIIPVVNQGGTTYTRKRERQMISMHIFKKKSRVLKKKKQSGVFRSLTIPNRFTLFFLHGISYIAESLLICYFITRILFCENIDTS